MSKKVTRPRGTRDFLPEEMAARNRALNIMKSYAKRYGFREISTPIFEHLELFTARSGEAIVSELYDFKDKGGRHLVLRPEMTAPVARMYVQSMDREYMQPVKVFYFTNVFRYERPQKGRYREFWQFGTETIGTDSVLADAELIALTYDMFKGLGLEDMKIKVGHIGLVRRVLDRYLPPDIHSDLLRAVDKGEKDQAGDIVARHVSADEAETLMRVLTLEGPANRIEEHIEIIKNIDLDLATETEELQQVARVIKKIPRAHIYMSTVRGLDYYSGIVFEVEAPGLGAENQICGGGRYDLAEAVGFKGTLDATGFAVGFDRALLALDVGGKSEERTGVYVIPMDDGYSELTFSLATEIRAQGIRAECDLMGRKAGKALKYANRQGYRYAVFIGEEEEKTGKYAFKDLESGEQINLTLEEIKDRLNK